MDWVSLPLSPSQIKEEILSPSQEQQQQPYYFRSPNPQSHGSFTLNNSSNNKVSPSILLLLVILAIIFFVSGLLHLLVRFLLRPQPRHPDDSDSDSLTALQGQLQQLFHLHDAGVDQSFIDTLPVFPYKSIIIANNNAAEKTPFDCAVCLCEFQVEDKLRLLPQCSHAFHMECIDTWLLSHSTCPLCRASLLPSTNPNPNPNPNPSFFSPVVLVLESGSSDSDTSREIVPETPNSVPSDQFGANLSHKSGEFVARTDPIEELKVVDGEDKEIVVPVKLGKFRNVDGGGGGEGSSNGNVDERRCFSMGSFEYVMDQNSSLQVSIRTPLNKQQLPRSKKPLTPGHRVAMSECDCDSRREFTNFTDFEQGNANGGDCKRESFSMSRIWLREKKKKKKAESSSRRAFSFRFPIGDEEEEEKKKGGGRRRTVSEIDMRMRRWEGDEEMEIQSCHSLESQPSSFARRTLLLWLVGRQHNKVVHSSSPSNPNV